MSKGVLRMSEFVIGALLQVGGGMVGGYIISYWIIKRRVEKDARNEIMFKV